MTLLVLASFVAVAATPYQHPPAEIQALLDAPEVPITWAAPGAEHLLLATPVRYPPLADRAAPMIRLAGLRVDPRTNSFYGETGLVSPTLRAVDGGREVPLTLPTDAVLLDVTWTADGDRFALTVRQPDRISLWVGGVDGKLEVIPDLRLSPLLGSTVAWLPDQDRLLVKRIDPARGEVPPAPAVPEGPAILSSVGGAASSTYEARDVLTSPYDEALFAYYAQSQIAIVDPGKGTVTAVGPADLYATVEASPDSKYLLVQRLEPPWSYQHAWYRFGHDLEVWTLGGELVQKVASVPLASAVPIQGVPEGPRGIRWRPTAPSTLVWLEALDGGDPIREATHRDRVMTLVPGGKASTPRETFRAQHRVDGLWWGKSGLLMVNQYERERRWRHVWTVNADKGPSSGRALFDLSANDRYADPGNPLTHPLPNGRPVLEQVGDDVFFVGDGGSPTGDRPFLDRRSLKTGKVERLFRSAPETFERFVAFVDPKGGRFLVRREAPDTVPNVHLVTLGAKVSAAAGEANFARTDRPVTTFVDPTPELRKIQKRIVSYTRADGTPLSFTLYLPADYVEGTRLPTVLYAYPREFSDPGTAGQIAGSQQTFDRFIGPTHLFFLLRGYAVLHNTTMPVIGDPETAYDTFVEQLVADAQAAIDQAVALGVTDPERVGVMGHSHGALMTATLLAHSDLFRAGIARSGAYNHTIRPFGFQSERRTLWEAPETYTALSPVMFAPDINEPLLLIHGQIDENPGTVPLQSERLFEAVRGTGGTVRLVTLPFEGHGYLARESVEHVLWEQISWFDDHVKNAAPRTAATESTSTGVQP